MKYEDLKKELKSIAGLVKEFPTEVQPRVFDLLTSTLAEGESPPKEKVVKKESVTKEKSPKKVLAKKKTTSGGKESYQLNRDLDLRGDKSVPSFRDFCQEKLPGKKIAKQFNAVAVYYLRKLCGHEAVTLNDVYTCYHEAGIKPPKAFKQSFVDTKNRAGWLEIDKEGNLDIPHRGAVFVQHDLPVASGTSQK